MKTMQLNYMKLVFSFNILPCCRCNLERHLNDVDFELVFELTREEFYRLPLWRRTDLKKRVRLF